MKRRILVFIQAAADVRYALSLVEAHQGDSMHLCVINVEPLYLFLREHNIKNVLVSFITVKQLSIKKPSYYFTAKQILHQKAKEIAETTKPDKIYFFSRFFDWRTAGIICKLLKILNPIEVVYYDHQDWVALKADEKIKPLSINYVLATFISKLRSVASGAKFVVRYKARSEEFAYWLYPIEHYIADLDVPVSDNVKYVPTSQGLNKVVLFYVSPDEFNLFNDRSIDLVGEIIKKFKNKGFRTFLKGHPRLGVPIEVSKMVDEVIPSFIPSEFISYTNVSSVIGFVSSSIANCALCEDVNAMSLMHMCTFVDPRHRAYYESYLTTLSNGTVKYPKTIHDIINQ